MFYQPLTPVVKNLIIINVIVFIGTLTLPESIKSMASLYFVKSAMFRPFQLVTYMFMHGNLMHLAFNMFSLYILGPYVERIIGSQRFFILYFASGFVAAMANWAFDAYRYYDIVQAIDSETLAHITTKGRGILLGGQNFIDGTLASLNRILNRGTVGASGCVYGVMLAFAGMFPDEKMIVFPLPFPIKMKYLALAAIVFGVVSGVGGYQQGIAHWAHVGGAVAGFMLISYWGYSKFR